MPIYEYECKEKHRFERFASITVKGEPRQKAKCPTCKRQGELVQSLTGTPKLKAGVGGFHKPNA